jgi:antitoxin ParD1/3/4
MRISLPAHLAAFVKEKVSIGRYRNANDAISDGLRLLQERDQEEFARLRELLQQRMKSRKPSSSVVFDQRLTESIRRRGMKRLATLKRTRG